MGLVVSRFRVPDPVSILPALRTRTEALLRRSVRLIVEPPYFLVTVAGMNVVVHEHADRREVQFGLVSALRSADRAKIREARRGLRRLGGVERAGGELAEDEDGRLELEAAVVDLDLDGGAQAGAEMAPGRVALHEPPAEGLRDGRRARDRAAWESIGERAQSRALDAARELAQPVPLGGSHPPAV